MASPLGHPRVQFLREVNLDTGMVTQLSIMEESGEVVANADLYANGVSLYWRATLPFPIYLEELQGFYRVSQAILGESIADNELAIFHMDRQTKKVAMETLSLQFVNIGDVIARSRRYGEVTFCSLENAYFHFWGEISSPTMPGERVGVSLKKRDLVRTVTEFIDHTRIRSHGKAPLSSDEKESLSWSISNIFEGQYGKGTYELP